MRRGSGPLRVVGALLVALLLFAWGYLAHRQQVFPYALIQSALAWFDPTRRVEMMAVDLDALKDLPYTGGAQISDGELRGGVTKHDEARTAPGYTLYSSIPFNEARLINVGGEVVHRWSHSGSKMWHHVELAPDGALYAFFEYHHLVKVDRDSKLLWRFDKPSHHDLDVDDDGRVYVLTQKRVQIDALRPDWPVDIDYVTVLSPDGEVVEEISFYDVVKNSSFSYLIPTTRLVERDIFHANTIEWFDGSAAHIDPKLFKRGNLLFSLRNIHLVGIYDPEAKALIWGWGPSNVYRQHQPSLLPNGHLLIFDNGETLSRVLELEPVSLQLPWSYGRVPGEGFFSGSRGGAQRLANGNTLIVESDRGRGFEVTADKKVVWDFLNPQIYVDKGVKHRGVIYRMRRFAPAEIDFLR